MAQRIAFVFPGQGSQRVGMGKELYESYPEARAVFEEANELLGFDLRTLCFEGPEGELNDTINAQPALLTTSIAALRVLESRCDLPVPAYVAGHSMGEYSALVAAGAVDFAAGLRLVRERGRVMKAAGEQNPGSMAAILGLSDDVVTEICQRVDGVQVANYNAPGQVVISGSSAGMERAMALAQEAGAKRVVLLAVSIAAHSALMAPAVEEFAQAVEATPFRAPRVPVVGNVTARPLPDVAAIREELVSQLTAPVCWVESVQYMIGQGVEKFIEIGPGDVLSKLIRRIERKVARATVGTPGDVQNLCV
jgi:[acyl-carrier-protein] S-malonyltransferase